MWAINNILFFTVMSRIIFKVICNECNVVSKMDWDGLEPIRVTYLVRPVDLVIIQHSVTQTCDSHSRCAETLRNIQTYYTDQLNYWDIGSSFYVGGNAKIYEGAGWFHEGAHTSGYNNRSIGISFIGNYNNDKPSAEQLEAVKALLKCGVDLGYLTTTYRVVGQKQLIATQSPGRRLYNKIRAWSQWAEDASSIRNGQ